ncbi:MAG: PadR family transcriptional regulator, partial [Methanocellales archaeon]|nr:PadR family transcriptional regulator [Methanocellales archaeon]
MDALIGLHERMVISTPNESTVVLPNFSLANKFDGNPSIDTISQEAMEQSVRKNLENIALSILQKEPMCGYDIIKTISHQYHVFLSQATVYPLLYSLEEQGLLETENDGRAKIYAPTERGKKIIENRLDEFTKAQEYLYNSIKTTSLSHQKKLNHFSH